MNSFNIVPWEGHKDILLPTWSHILLLIEPSKMKELKLQKLSPVLLTSTNGELLLKASPCKMLNGSTTALPAFSLFKHYTNSEVSLDLFQCRAYHAERVIFTPVRYGDFMDSETFRKYLKKKLGRMYLKDGMVLHIKYLGYPCCFTVQNVYNRAVKEHLLGQLNKSNLFANPISSLEDSFSEKCYIDKNLRPLSSTPISSRTQSQSSISHNLQQKYAFPFNEDVKSINPHSDFYYINSKTRFFVRNPALLKRKVEEIVGLDEHVDDIKSSITSLLNHGFTLASQGIVVIGPSGTGKSLLLDNIQYEYSQQLSVYYLKNRIFKESYGIDALRRMLKEAVVNLPSLVLIDDVDELCTNENQPDRVKRLKDEISYEISKFWKSSTDVLIIATSQDELSVPDSLMKHDSLDKVIKLPNPSPACREKILKHILKRYENELTPNQINQISKMAHGFAGGDLRRLCEEASNLSNFSRCLTFLDFQKGLKMKPASVSEFSGEVPNVKWSDIVGRNEACNAVKEMVEWPLKYPDRFKYFKITPSRGILLYGPPGCGKTMIAKAIATESQLNFINVKSAAVFNKYVGESEKAISQIFRKATAASPCILFFDEIDSLAPIRGSTNSKVTDRVATQLLIELDGIDVLEQGVCVIAATNRPDKIDPSLLRPGRFDRLLYMSLPDAPARKEIFKVKCEKKPCSSDIDWQYLVDKTENYTGAEIHGAVNEAIEIVYNEYRHTYKGDSSSKPEINMEHFRTALRLVQPKTTQEMLHVYTKYHNKF